MNDTWLVALTAVSALLVLLVVVITAPAIAARREARQAQRRADAIREERHHPGDDVMTLADALGINRVHEQCRRLYRSGFRSHVHSDCLDILEREEQR